MNVFLQVMFRRSELLVVKVEVSTSGGAAGAPACLLL